MTDTAPETTSAPELTLADRHIAVLERLAELRPELGQLCKEMADLERARERSRALEAKTKVTLSPDNRGWTGAPPPSSTSHAAPSPERPSGWAKLDPISSPPGVALCDAMMDAQDARDRAELVRQNRQAVIDLFHEAKLAEEQQHREQAERQSFHKAPGDPDWVK
jgi:hypothetical protein